VPAQAHNHQGNPTSHQPEGQKQRGGNVALWGRGETWSSQGQPRSGMLWHILVKQRNGTTSLVFCVTVPRMCHFTYMLKDLSFWQLQVEARRCTITLSFTLPLSATYPLSLSPSSAHHHWHYHHYQKCLHCHHYHHHTVYFMLHHISLLWTLQETNFFCCFHVFLPHVRSHFVTFRWFCQVLLADYTVLPASTLSTYKTVLKNLRITETLYS